MAHLIESAAFSAAEGAGWTGLGRAIPEEIAKDPLALAKFVGATYSVLLAPLTYTFYDPSQDPRNPPKLIQAENRVARIRSDNGKLLEVTSENRYHTDNRQPVDIFESFRDELAKENLTISHAAVLDGGRKIAVCAKLADVKMDIGDDGKDKTCPYVTGSTGYDAKTGTNYFLTGIRTVCANTLRMGMMDALKKGRLIRYAASSKLGADSLKGLLLDAMNVINNEIEFYQKLTQVKMDDPAAKKYFADIIGVNLDLIGTKNADGRKVISTRTENQLNGLMTAYHKAPGSDLATAKDTLYGALNAVTYITDHEAQIRDTQGDGPRLARITSATFGNGAQVKGTAVRVAQSIMDKLITEPVGYRTAVEFTDLLAKRRASS